jgi:hypothetical protein
MSDELFYLINDLTNDDLYYGHDKSAPPSRCLHSTFDPEDDNMGDEAFVSVDAYQ